MFPPGYAPPPGYPVPPPGYSSPSYSMAYPRMQTVGYPVGTVAPTPDMPYAVPVGQVSPDLTAHIGFAAFAAGMPPSAYAGIAHMMGIPQPPPSDDPRNRITTGHWDTGLFRCCDDCIPNGFMSCLCPCVSLAQILTRLGNPRYGAVLVQFACMWILPIVARLIPEIMLRSMGDEEFELPIFINIPLLFPLIMTEMMAVGIRSRIRTRFRIPGTPCDDCAVTCCCGPCAIAQIATHVKSYKTGTCSFDQPDMLLPFL